MRTLTVPIRRVDAVAFSPDGAELAAGGAEADGDGRGLIVFPVGGDLAAGRRGLDGHTVVALEYTADGRWLLAGAMPATAPPYPGGGLYRLDPRTLDDQPTPLHLGVYASTAGERLLGMTAERTEHGLSQQFASCRLLADGTLGPLWDVACGPDEQTAAVALLPEGRAATLTLTLRSAATGQVLATATPPGHTTGRLHASPDGERLVLNAGTSLYAWQVADLAAPPRKITFGKKHCTGVGFAPDGRLLAAGNDGTVRRLDPDTGVTLATYTFAAGKVRSLAVAPDGLTAAVGTDRGTVIVFDLD